jgi:iron complex outermembrane receptor protein
LDHAAFTPERDRPARDFTDPSGSIGLVFHPAATHERVSFSFSLASAARHPALEELYYFGPHPGNFAFEIGNPDLQAERALGFDLSLRWNAPRASGEITYFRNSIDRYVFRNPITNEEFASRYGAEEEPEFPVVEYVGADSLLQGVEIHTDAQLARHVFGDLTFDYVRGELRASGDPLPRMPPMRLRGGLRYQASALQAGGEVAGVARQDRVFGAETPTDGYTTLRLFAAYSFGSHRNVQTITARLENATNELYRNHLSYIKDLVPEIGRNFRLVYSVRF